MKNVKWKKPFILGGKNYVKKAANEIMKIKKGANDGEPLISGKFPKWLCVRLSVYRCVVCREMQK